MELPAIVRTVLWGVAVWAAMTLVTVAIVAAVAATLPETYFREESATRPAGGTPAGRFVKRLGRNLCGLLLIAAGVLLSIPGVPGQGILTVLAGVVLVDFPGRHRAARAIARWRGVLPALNGLRARFGRPPLLPPEEHPRR